jgi:flagellar hook-associated protein 2
MAGLSLSGLASGLDTDALVTSLLAVERQPRTRAEARQQVVEARKSTLNDIQTRLKSLQTAVTDLRSVTLFAPAQTIESSDPTRVAVTRTGGVGTGAYMVKIDQVAAAEQRSYTYSKQAAESTIAVDGHAVTIPANAELDDVVAKLNSDPDGKVWASKVGDKLAFSWRATGEDAKDDVVAGTALSSATVLREGRNALLHVDGKPYTPSGNTFTEIAGLELTLKAPTSADVAITVGPPGPDVAKVTEKLKAFVDAYNAANDLMRTELREEKVQGAANRVDRGKGVLRGDPGITSLQARLRQVLSETVRTGSTAADQLADLGISTGAASGTATFSRDAVDGKLTLDAEKLKATLAAEPTRVQQLLGADGGDGLAQRLEAVLAPATKLDGELDARKKSADDEVKRLKDQMTALDTRLELREKALRAMFTRLEQSMQASNSQSSYLGSQLAALTG